MSYRVRIGELPDPVEVEMGQTILAAALDAGVPYPHGCQSGNCGACKSRLLAGEVEMLPWSEYALSDGEHESGLILACRAVPWSDAEVAWLDEGETVSHPLRRLECRVAGLAPLTHDITEVRLEVLSGGPFRFSAGQYCEISFTNLPVREYSMANLPDQDHLLFHIRHVPGGAVSGHVAKGLKPGDPVRAAGPHGAAWLRDRHKGPILAVAGGSGLAPVISIVGQALALGMAQDIHLYIGVRDSRDLYLQDRLARLAASHPNLHVVPVLSAPSQATPDRTGMVHEAVAADFADLEGFKAYLAGPPAMVVAVSDVLAGRGMVSGDIHADAFYTAAEKAEREAGR